MNRRAFLQRFGIGVTAALALASLPVSAIESLTTEQAAKRCAIEYLRKRYNEHVRGKKTARFDMHVSPGLFDAYEGELVACERFTIGDAPPERQRHLMFKGVRIMPHQHLSGWDVQFAEHAA